MEYNSDGSLHKFMGQRNRQMIAINNNKTKKKLDFYITPISSKWGYPKQNTMNEYS